MATLTEKEFKALVEETIEEFDIVYDTFWEKDFTEIVGTTGGDAIVRRVYKSGLVGAK